MEFEESIEVIEQKIKDLADKNAKPSSRFDREIAKLKDELRSVQKEVYAKLTPWQSVQIARNKDRPLMQDYIAQIFRDYVELHGDRTFGDDRALVGGFATIEDYKVMLLGFNKGKNVEEKVRNNFGMAHPEGYRKALRLMRLAEKYNLPIVCLVDTPAAYPGAAAEERGQAEAIARNITEMSTIQVPIVVVVTGEGGSGGALGIGVGDVVMMLSNSIYSVIPPEGCAAILWRDSNKAPEAAESLKLTAKSLLDLKVIDEIIPEPLGGAHRDSVSTTTAVRKALVRRLHSLKRLSPRKLLARRFDKYARMGR
jgi:acetyl-CoA carboxylase carboxyl transferase subunit alpha